MRVGSLSSLQPLRHRNFALMWFGGLVSNVGSWMQTVAVGALVTAKTGQATWTVLVAAGAFLPVGLFSPLGGVLADRLSRRRVLMITNIGQAVLAGVLAILIVEGVTSPAILTLVVTLQGCINAVGQPFRQAILPDLVPRSELLPAASLGSAQYNLGRIAGPALAAVTIAAFGYPVAFIANAISFFAIVAALIPIQLPMPIGKNTEMGLFASMRLGAKESMAEPACRAAIIAVAVVGLLGSPFIALVPFVARQLQHHATSRELARITGVLTTAQGLGAVAGALLITPIGNIVGRGRLLVGGLLGLPIVLLLYDFSPNVTLAMIMITLVGFFYLMATSGMSAVVQYRAPALYRGRILSFYIVALGISYPIGSLIDGPLADRFGLHWVTGVSAGILALVTYAAAIFLRRTRHELIDSMTMPPTTCDESVPVAKEQVIAESAEGLSTP